MPLFHDFFEDMDRRWGGPTPRKIRLRIIGSSALMLQTRYERGTKDSDVLETHELTADLKRRMLALAGQGSELHKRHGLYIDVVSNGVPFLPQAALYHERANVNASLNHFEIEVLDVVDVVVSKLKRFHANDRSDIGAMIDLGLVSHHRLVSRFKEAIDYFLGDARERDLPKYWRNLNAVERDLLDVPQTDVDLPDWIDR